MKTCRHCQSGDLRLFVDLGHAPPSNAYLSAGDLDRPEVTFPLRVFVCGACRLVQTQDYATSDELFTSDYAYFSSTSSHWLAHAEAYAGMIAERLGLNRESFVVELASNDGYLLKNFVAAGIPCLGVEPTASTAQAARNLGIEVAQEFFGEEFGRGLAGEGRKADLVIGNNVYAHVPDINDFTRGIAAVLKPEGVVTLEFPHLLRLIEECQFDTIYHEHFSYLSLLAVERIFGAAGLRVFDVEELPTHGGSLRVYGCLAGAGWGEGDAVSLLRKTEAAAGLDTDAPYAGFQARVEAVKHGFLRFLLETKAEGRTVAAYGAAAKGNTLMNYAGVRPDLLPFVCDAAAAKQGKFMPGSHLPIHPPSRLTEDRPDYILILPWNIAAEVTRQLADLAGQGSQFVVAVPEVRVL